MIQIPTFQNISSDNIQTIDLNGQIVTLRVVYNIRNSFFHLRFTDPEGGTLLGIKIVPNWLLLDQRKALINFEGDLIIQKVDLEAEDVITYENFGSGWVLRYLDPQEVSDWKRENGF